MAARAARTTAASSRRGWSKQDLTQLRSMSRAKLPASKIGQELGRTPGAIRQKASAEGIALGRLKRITMGKTTRSKTTRAATRTRRTRANK